MLFNKSCEKEQYRNYAIYNNSDYRYNNNAFLFSFILSFLY